MASSLRERLRRGHLFARLLNRGWRELRAFATYVVLGLSRPTRGVVAIATLNSDEENATVTAVQAGNDHAVSDIIYVSPEPHTAREAVRLAARNLDLAVPTNVRFEKLSARTLLNAYRQASTTYSTHVLLPGRDLSGRRRHVHLTHGSGPKPDTTFRGPATALASITPQWIPHQLEEYKLPKNTEIIPWLPRLEVMRSAIGDTTVKERLGVPADRPLVVWAPTYRVVKRGREIRVSGTPIHELIHESEASLSIADLVSTIAEANCSLIIKVHPHEHATYEPVGAPVETNTSLREKGLTPYQLFGAADLVITDYSSVYLERGELDLAYALYLPDHPKFENSYRGLRTPRLLHAQMPFAINSKMTLVAKLMPN